MAEREKWTRQNTIGSVGVFIAVASLVLANFLTAEQRSRLPLWAASVLNAIPYLLPLATAALCWWAVRHGRKADDRVVELQADVETMRGEQVRLDRRIKEEALQSAALAETNKELRDRDKSVRENLGTWGQQRAQSREHFFRGGGITVESATLSLSTSTLRLTFRNYGVLNGTVGALNYHKVVVNAAHQVLNDTYRLNKPNTDKFHFTDVVTYEGRTPDIVSAIARFAFPPDWLALHEVHFTFTEEGQGRASQTVFMNIRVITVVP